MAVQRGCGDNAPEFPARMASLRLRNFLHQMSCVFNLIGVWNNLSSLCLTIRETTWPWSCFRVSNSHAGSSSEYLCLPTKMQNSHTQPYTLRKEHYSGTDSVIVNAAFGCENDGGYYL
jgi:hypothetical protein